VVAHIGTFFPAGLGGLIRVAPHTRKVFYVASVSAGVLTLDHGL